MFTFVMARPGVVALFVVAALVVLPLTLLLTVGREPTATVPVSPVRSDGCVMFCAGSVVEGGDR
ncbi:hypothetical protein AB0B25_05380 [Nocardia sp. NPDC049190]|uniref:hypothetical protein n=1 Tax=Nocardia sp. NPDC049190 TaxID=3155650 RepID=UPI0033E3A265